MPREEKLLSHCTKIVQIGQFCSLLPPYPSIAYRDSGYGREKGTTPPDVPNLRLLFTR